MLSSPKFDLNMPLFSATCFIYLLAKIAPSSAARDNKECVRWGAQFEVPLRSNNVRKDCVLPDGRPVCCAAVLSNSTYTDDTTKSSRGIGYSYTAVKSPTSSAIDTDTERTKTKLRCNVSKIYISSPQEERDLKVSQQLEKMASPEERLDALLKYVVSDEMVNNATKWLSRVAAHMQSERILESTDVDREFLSRFHVSRRCGDSGDLTEWDEWIEPVNIAARHPFAFSRCRNTWHYFKGKQGADRSDVDYVLLQSGIALADRMYQPSGE